MIVWSKALLSQTLAFWKERGFKKKKKKVWVQGGRVREKTKRTTRAR